MNYVNILLLTRVTENAVQRGDCSTALVSPCHSRASCKQLLGACSGTVLVQTKHAWSCPEKGPPRAHPRSQLKRKVPAGSAAPRCSFLALTYLAD